MKLSDKGIKFMKSFEELRLTSYLCESKVWTIGYGHTAGVRKGQKITEEQAEEFFRQDSAWAEKAVNNLQLNLSQNEFDALVSLVFNIGEDAWGKSTIRRYLLTGVSKIKIADQFLVWTHSKGKYSAGLQRRRLKERQIFFYNNYEYNV